MAGTINMNKVNAPETDLKPDVETAAVSEAQQDTEINLELTEDTKETASDCGAPAPYESDKKHTCTYMGNGVWTDQNGMKWMRKDTHVFTDHEFSLRFDIQYMIEYGAILHSES